MSWHTQGPPLREDEDERELKCQFARFAVENPVLANEAGYHVFPGPENYGRALQANTAWPHCPIVRAEKRRLAEDGQVSSMLPSPEQVKKAIWDRSNASIEDKDALAGMRLYCEVEGLIKKGPSAIFDNRTINVLRVPMRDVTPEDDIDFERRFEQHQTALVANVRNRSIQTA